MRWSILILVTLLSLGCTKKEPAASPEPADPAAEAAAEAAPEAKAIMDDPTMATDFNLADLPPLPPELGGETPAVDAAANVLMMQTGSEPRRALRYDLAVGSEQKVTVELGMKIDAIVALLRTGKPLQTYAHDLTLRANKKKNPDGSVRVTFHVDATRPVFPTGMVEEVPAEQAAAVQKAHAIRGSYVLGARGQVSEFQAVKQADGEPAAPGKVDAFRWAIQQLTPVLPEEPVGQGAQWKVHEPIMQGGVHAQQLRTLDLVELEDSGAKLDVKVRQTAAPQPYTNPLTGASFQLESLNGVAEGSMTWSANAITPVSASIDADSVDGALYFNADKSRKAGLAVQWRRTVRIR